MRVHPPRALVERRTGTFRLLVALAVCWCSSSGARADESPCIDRYQLDRTALLALARNNTAYLIFSSGEEARRVQIQGVDGTLIGFDYRPSDRRLYAVSDASELYVLSRQSSGLAATRVTTIDPAFTGGTTSFVDFNPTNNGAGNALRLIGRNDQNYAIVSSEGGPPSSTVVQTEVRYTEDDPAADYDPSIAAGAYDNNMDGAATTTLYMIDSDRNTIVTIDDRNAAGSSNTAGGSLRTLGRLVDDDGDRINADWRAGLDIYTPTAGQNIAVAAMERELFCIDLGAVNPDVPADTLADVHAVRLVRESRSLRRATSADIIDVVVVPPAM